MFRRFYQKLCFVLLAFTLMMCNITFAQNITIKGIVKDISSKEPLPFANIILKGAGKGTTTNVDGIFELRCEKGNQVLIVSYIGYKTENISLELTENKELSVQLTSTNVLLQEVTVYASKTNSKETASSHSLESKQLEAVSTAFPDVFRSIQSLPGIAVNNEFSAKFNVRGGNYDENLVLVNNSQVYEPFHLKMADNASVGIFNTDLMRKVNLIAGGFSAKYGDRLSSVLDIEYREGQRDKFSGSANLSLTNLDAVFEGPLGNFGSFILGARKSYLEYALMFMDKEDLNLSFYDIQGVLTIPLTQNFKTNIKFIHAGDDFLNKPEFSQRNPYKTNGNINGDKVIFTQNSSDYYDAKMDYFSNLIDIQNNYIISGNAFLSASLSYYEQRDNENSFDKENYSAVSDNGAKYYFNSEYNSTYKNSLNIKTIDANLNLDLKISPYYEIKTGFGYINLIYDREYLLNRFTKVKENIYEYPNVNEVTYDYSEAATPLAINASSYKLSGFIENIIQVSDNIIINGGMRYDYFDINKETNISPRLSATYQFEDGLRLRAAWGHYYQSPIYRQLAMSTTSENNTKAQKAEHYILGIEKGIVFGKNNSNLNLKVEVFYKKYSNLIESRLDSRGIILYSQKNDSKGYAAGFDLMVSLQNNWYNGWISYGLLFAKEQNILKNEAESPRITDQRHTLSLINGLNLGKNWNLNININYGSGFASTPKIAVTNPQTKQKSWQLGAKNSERIPEYKRVDLKIGKEFELFGYKSVAFLEISNAFNFKNVYAYSYRFDTNGNPMRVELKLFPVIPSLGLKINF